MSEEQGCKKCKQVDFRFEQIAVGLFGFWILGTSIFGSYIIIKDFINFVRQVFGI